MGRFVAFRKRGKLLRNTVLNDDKILGVKPRNVVSFLVGHRDVELHHIDNHVKIGALLSFDSRSISDEQTEEKPKRQNQVLCHNSYSASPSNWDRCINCLQINHKYLTAWMLRRL